MQKEDERKGGRKKGTGIGKAEGQKIGHFLSAVVSHPGLVFGK